MARKCYGKVNQSSLCYGMAKKCNGKARSSNGKVLDCSTPHRRFAVMNSVARVKQVSVWQRHYEPLPRTARAELSEAKETHRLESRGNCTDMNQQRHGKARRRKEIIKMKGTNK